MLRRIAALVLAPAILLGGAGLAHAATTTTSDTNAASFVSKTNAERQARGLRPYVVKSDLTAVATRHSARMASKNTLYHNPNLGSDVDNWQVVGENVGMGGTVESIHQAFMDSQHHRENILSREFTEVGIGTVTDSRGVIWVTQVFRLPLKTAAISAPVSTQASRSVTRAPVRAAAPKPVKVVAKAPARPVRTLVAARPDADVLAGALAPASPTFDSLTLALAYADTMKALAR